MLPLDRLRELLDEFPRLSVGLIGDLFLDRYLEIEPHVHEVSLETGLEAYQVTRVRNAPGALGTVINNLAALGVGRCVPVTVVGKDGHGYDLLQELSRLPVEQTHILQRSDRLTPTYTKPLRPTAAGIWEELNRLDVRTRSAMSRQLSDLVCEHLCDVFHQCDGLIVLDQVWEHDWGVVNDGVREVLAELCHAYPGKLVMIDSRAHLARFRAGTLKCNRAELQAAMSAQQGELEISEAAQSLVRRTDRSAFVTLGMEGILVAQPEGSWQRVPAREIDGPIDTVGAGDSVTAALVASMLAGATPLEAAHVGNLVASVTITKIGCTGTATPEELMDAHG